MSKRFTDTDIWKKQRWFRKLSPTNKLVFCYIKDMCNHAGIWRVECSDLIDDLGLEEFNMADFITAVNLEFDKVSGSKINKERLILLDGNLLWLTGFVQFQYEGKEGKVNPDAAPVRTALMALQGLSIPSITLTHPLHKCSNVLEYALQFKLIRLIKDLQEGWTTPKDKDKDKERKGSVREKQKNGMAAKKIVEGVAYFPDETSRELTLSEQSLFDMGELKMEHVLKSTTNVL